MLQFRYPRLKYAVNNDFVLMPGKAEVLVVLRTRPTVTSPFQLLDSLAAQWMFCTDRLFSIPKGDALACPWREGIPALSAFRSHLECCARHAGSCTKHRNHGCSQSDRQWEKEAKTKIILPLPGALCGGWCSILALFYNSLIQFSFLRRAS